MVNYEDIINLVKINKLQKISHESLDEIQNFKKKLNQKKIKIKPDYAICYFLSKIDNLGKKIEKGLGANHVNIEKIDYRKVLYRSISNTLKNTKNSLIYIICDKKIKLKNFKSDRVIVIYLNLKNNETMFTRVKLFNAFVNSNLFCCNTVFLDTDVFINIEIKDIFKLNFDIGLTYRKGHKMIMPINEGVIFIKKNQFINQFFLYYLKTYENLLKNQRIKKFFPNIKLWRGGQLSLNAIAETGKNNFSYLDLLKIKKNKIYFFPCHDYNYKPKRKNYAEIDNKFLIHLKGNLKQELL